MTQPPEPQSNLSESEPAPRKEQRSAQGLLPNLVRWLPVSSSSAIFIGFLLKQEWGSALLSSLPTAITGIWAAYSKPFVARLGEIFAERGKSDADRFVNWLDSLHEALNWQFSGFDTKYLKCQRLDCQDDDPHGIKDEGAVTPLQEVFVPLQLSADSVISGYMPRPKDSEECQGMLIWDLLRQVRQQSIYRQIAIRAWGGYGKTTLLKHVAYTYSVEGHRKYRAPKLVPFLLYLARCRKELMKENPPSLPQLLTDYHLPRLPQGEDLKVPPNWALNLLRQAML